MTENEGQSSENGTKDNLAAALSNLLVDLRPASSYYLSQALMAAGVEGISGTLVIRLPSRNGKDKPDVTFIGGTIKMILE